MKKTNEKENAGGKKPFYKKWWFWVIIGVVVIALISGSATGNKTDVPETTVGTETTTEEISEMNFDESTSTEEIISEETQVSQEEKLIIEIEGDTDGQYSTLLVFNEGTEDEMSRYVQIIPAGTYKATNIDYQHDIGGLNVYSEELHTGSTGFDEFKEIYGAEMVKKGESVVVTIEEGQCIYIPSPGLFLFEQQ